MTVTVPSPGERWFKAVPGVAAQAAQAAQARRACCQALRN